MNDDRCDICGHLVDDHRQDGGACYVGRCKCTGSEAAPEPPPQKKKAKKKAAKKK
jgi:hypothetical protein